MRLTFLGTGSSYPSPKRGASGLVLQLDQSKSQWLFDCGEGTQIQGQKAVTVKLGSIDVIFISHLHGDHLFGLPGLLCTMAQRNAGLQSEVASGGDFTKSTLKTVHIIGPKGLRLYLRMSLGLSSSQLIYRYSCHELHHDLEKRAIADWCEMVPHECGTSSVLPFELPGHDIFENEHGFWDISKHIPFNANGMKVSAIWLKHSIPSFGWIMQEPDFPGTLNISHALSLGVPRGPLLGELKVGKNITLPDGTVIHSRDVVGASIPGRCICIMGDSSDSSALLIPELKLTALRTRPILVHEVTLEDEMYEDALSKGHSTPSMVAKLVTDLKLQVLVAHHFSQRYDDDSVESKLKPQLLQAIPSDLNVDVICARDLMIYEIPSPKDLMFS